MLAVVLLGLGLAAAPSVPAVQSLVYTFVVPCDDESGVSSDDVAEVTLPSGNYLVTAVGACSVTTENGSTTTSTPCTEPGGGGIPCVTTSVQNIPGQACWTTVGAATTRQCYDDQGTVLNGCMFTVTVNGQCLTAGTTGTVWHSGGVMTARFEDLAGWYWDNTGAFIVTVAWTPL